MAGKKGGRRPERTTEISQGLSGDAVRRDTPGNRFLMGLHPRKRARLFCHPSRVSAYGGPWSKGGVQSAVERCPRPYSLSEG